MATPAQRRNLGAGSVGTKLSAATLIVVALVAVAVYWGLSRYERRSRFEAKEQAAVMVMQLFAANLSAPLTFTDATGVTEAVSSVSSNREIEFAAAWSVDADRPDVLGDRLGVLSRSAQPPPPPSSIPAKLRTRFTPTHVIVEAPVKEPSGKIVGAAQLGFSTAREEAVIADIEQRVLWLSMGSALGLMVMLSLASRAVVLRPLQRLTNATAALKRGEKPEALVPTRDEIGELTQAFTEMSQAIATREQRIVDRNRDMLRILDNAEDGFITVNRAGIMSDERSQILERWFGPADGSKFVDYFAKISPELAEPMSLSWEALVEEVMPLALLLDQMPKGFARDGRHFQIRYRTIPGPNGDFESLLVVIHDATEAVLRDRAEQRQRETLAIFRRLLTDQVGWQRFFDSGSAVVEQLASAEPPDHVTTRRLLHTLKGDCAVMGMESLARFVHEMEGRLVEGAAGLSTDDAQALSSRWNDLGSICAQLGAKATESRPIAISASEHEELLLALERSPNLKALARRVASWRDEPAADRLARIREQIEVLSRKLGKGEPEVVIEADELRVPADAFAEFWAVLAHVVRNAVDHGFETAEERAAAGKSPKNRVRLRAFALDERGFVLSLSDDGRGIDWEKVARKAVAAGLPSATQADLEQALYADTISTRDQVSETSGRGVGLGAVRAAVTALGGSIEIESDLGRGTTFRFTLPWPTPERSATAPNQVGTLATARAEPRSATFRLGQARDADGSDEPAMSTLSNSMDGST